MAPRGGATALQPPEATATPSSSGIHMEDLALSTSAGEPIVSEQDVHATQRNGPNDAGNDTNTSKNFQDEVHDGEVKGDPTASGNNAGAPTFQNDKELEEPEGGKYGVRAVIGGFGITFCTWGMSGSWTVLQDSYERNQLSTYSSSDIAWIGSLQTCMIYASSALAGRLFDQGYMSWILLFSCIATTVSFMLASISTQYWHFLLSQGLLMGIGLGASFSPALACVASYYRRRRGIASGLLSAGSAFGGLILPIAQSKMIANPKIGLGWALRMTGFLALLFQGTAYLIMRQKPTIPSKKPLIDVSVYRQKAYAISAVSLFFTTISIFYPVFFIQPFAVSQGVSSDLVFYSIAILNGASLIGRIFPLMVADKFGPYNVLALTVAIQAILIFGFTGIRNFAGVVAFSVLNGIAYGCYVTVNPVVLAFMSDTPARIGTHIGMVFLTNSIAALAGPPALGAVITASGGYWQSAIIAGVCSFISFLLMLWARSLIARTRGTPRV